MRRKTVVIGISYLCGLFLASFLSVDISCVVMVAVTVLSIAGAFAFKPEYFLMVGISFVFAVGLYTFYTITNYDKVTAFDGQTVVFTGEVRDVSYLKSDMYSLTLRGKLDGVTTDVSFYTGAISVDYGDTVTLKAKVSKTSDGITYQAEKYKKPNGEFLTGGYAQILSVTAGGFSLRKSILHYRDYIFEMITEKLPGEEGGFIAAMLCGDKSELELSTRTDLYRSGIGHIFSVSGMHLVIITAAVMWLLKKLRVSFYPRFIVSEFAMFIFVIFAGASVSVVRAAIMMTLLNFSSVAKRKYDCLTAILISVIIMTLGSPYSVRSASFLLSFGGAFALGVAAPMVTAHIKQGTSFAGVKKSFAAMITVSGVLLPINLMFFDEISVIAPVANVLLIPLFSAALMLAAAAAVVGGLFPLIATPLLVAAGLIAKVILLVARVLSGMPFAYIPTGYKNVVITALLCWLIIVVIVTACRQSSAVTVIAIAMALICFVVSSVVNRFMLADTMRVYCLNDNNAQMLVIVKGDECAVVNIKGRGNLSQAVKRLCDCKGVDEIVGFYNLADNLTAVSSLMKYVDIKSEDTSCCVGGAYIQRDTNGVSISFDEKSIFISADEYEPLRTDDYAIYGESFLVDNNGSLNVCELTQGCTEIMIDDDSFNIRRLDYGFAE